MCDAHTTYFRKLKVQVHLICQCKVNESMFVPHKHCSRRCVAITIVVHPCTLTRTLKKKERKVLWIRETGWAADSVYTKGCFP